MTLELVIKIFQTYLIPIFTYCAPIWTNDIRSNNNIQKLNAVFTNYIKKYLGLPKYAHNAAVHYYCGTWPLYNAIKNLAQTAATNINFPPNCIDGHQLTFANNDPLPIYDPETEMEDDFPRKRPHISRNRYFRRKQFRDIFDVNHYQNCTLERFHTKKTDECKCLYCGNALARDHKCYDS